MKAAFIKEHGGLDKIHIGDLKNREPKANEISIDIKYSALNHIDIFLVKGWSGLKLKMPHIIGSDASGFIKKVGSEVTGLKKGDKIVINPGVSCGKCYYCLAGKQNFCNEYSILGENEWGTFAEEIVLPEINVLKIRNDLNLKKAAAAPLTFLTAWRMLVSQANIRPNETIFIHGAGGGVASAAIQIAKYFKAKVITSTSSAEKMEKAKEIGADYVINYKENKDFGKYVFEELTERKGIDIVIDSVGQNSFPTSIKLLKPGGRLVICGATTGPNVELDLRYIFWKQLIIKGSTMSNQKEFRDVMDLIFKRKLDPIIDKIYPLDEIITAEQYLQEGNQFGKILLKVN